VQQLKNSWGFFRRREKIFKGLSDKNKIRQIEEEKNKSSNDLS